LSGLLAALLPPLVAWAGVAAMAALPQGRAAASVALRPLYRGPYDRAYAETYWGTLGAAPPLAGHPPLASERFLLKIDLLFPPIYGGALAAGLWCSAHALGRPDVGGWLMLAVLLMMVADWTENLVQLAELSRFTATGRASAGWIALASTATGLKSRLVIALVLLNVAAGLWVFVRALGV
jgi:hypothetical protein